MKKPKKQHTSALPIKKEELKWYTLEEVFEKASKTKGFKEAYEKEVERRRLARSIREARLSKGLTQAAVASKVETPQSVIARLESGLHSVSVDTLSKVAHALGKKIELV